MIAYQIRVWLGRHDAAIKELHLDGVWMIDVHACPEWTQRLALARAWIASSEGFDVLPLYATQIGALNLADRKAWRWGLAGVAARVEDGFDLAAFGLMGPRGVQADGHMPSRVRERMQTCEARPILLRCGKVALADVREQMLEMIAPRLGGARFEIWQVGAYYVWVVEPPRLLPTEPAQDPWIAGCIEADAAVSDVFDAALADVRAFDLEVTRWIPTKTGAKR